MKWFKHDSDANMDAKIQEILLDYGLEGYGLYFYCLELIVNKISSDNLTFELEHDARIIARNTGSTPKKVEEMMRKFVELGLFEPSGSGGIRCIKLLNRLDSSMTSNLKMRKLIQTAKEHHSHDGVMISHDGVMLNADSVMQEENRIDKKRIEEKKDNSNLSIDKVTTDPEFVKPKSKEKVPYQEIVDTYHKIMPELPQVYKLTPTRKSYIAKLYREEMTKREHWENFFDYVRKSDFLMGRTNDPNRKPFKADLEWITKPANFVKIAEEKYHG